MLLRHRASTRYHADDAPTPIVSYRRCERPMRECSSLCASRLAPRASLALGDVRSASHDRTREPGTTPIVSKSSGVVLSLHVLTMGGGVGSAAREAAAAFPWGRRLPPTHFLGRGTSNTRPYKYKKC
jgi:hypothetical protein